MGAISLAIVTATFLSVRFRDVNANHGRGKPALRE